MSTGVARGIGRILAALLTASVLGSGCSSGDDGPDGAQDQQAEVTASTTTAGSDVAPDTDTDGADPDAADPDDDAARRLAALGVASISLSTPESGEGRRPLLAWEPVEEAVQYQVVLLAPSGDPYWGWITSETSVPVGGEPALIDEAAGPSVVEGMTWSVSAYDVDNDLVGLSPQGAIGP